MKAIAAFLFFLKSREIFRMLCRCGGARIFQVTRKIVTMIEVYLYRDKMWH